MSGESLRLFWISENGRRSFHHRFWCPPLPCQPGVCVEPRFNSVSMLKVNGDWLSDAGNQISGSAQSLADTLGSQETWDSVQAAFESMWINSSDCWLDLLMLSNCMWRQDD